MVVAGAAALALAACGSTAAQTPLEQPKTVTFNDLGGGSAYIQVYPGVGITEADQTANGTFSDGQSVVADCVTTGRIISSNPELGEIPRESNQWVRIEGAPGKTQYATETYLDQPVPLLPVC